MGPINGGTLAPTATGEFINYFICIYIYIFIYIFTFTSIYFYISMPIYERCKINIGILINWTSPKSPRTIPREESCQDVGGAPFKRIPITMFILHRSYSIDTKNNK